jgi:hypothetical protein
VIGASRRPPIATILFPAFDRILPASVGRNRHFSDKARKYSFIFDHLSIAG